jgi:hypothetical protein
MNAVTRAKCAKLNEMEDHELFRDSMMLDAYCPEMGAAVPDERLPFRDPDLSAREKELLDEVNLLRKDPAAYAELLVRRRKHFYLTSDLVSGDPPQRNPNLTEGKKAVLEAIEFLQKAKPVKLIRWKDGLHLASQDIRNLIAGQATTQPTSPDQVNRAIYSYGEYQGRATQLCGWGYSNPVAFWLFPFVLSLTLLCRSASSSSSCNAF